MAVLFTLTGIIFLFYGICLCVLSNMNLGVAAIVLMGAVFLLCGIFYEKIKELTQRGILKYLKIFAIAAFIAELVFTVGLALYGERDNVTYKEQAVIVLGAGIRGDKVTLPLKLRLDKAIEYSKKNPDGIIVVSGGQGFQESVTEAYAMEKYLTENGVSPDKIIKEEKATSTNENMRFSKDILDSKFDEPYEIAVISNGFHIYRGVAIAHEEGFENVTHMHAGLQWYNVLPCYIRESIAVLKLWIL